MIKLLKLTKIQKIVKKYYSTRKKRQNIKQTGKSIIKMEHYKISELLNNSALSKFVTKKQIEVNDLSSGQYSASKNTRFKTSTLRSDLCDYNYAYIVVKRRISVRGKNANNQENKNVTFKTNVSFRPCISKSK